MIASVETDVFALKIKYLLAISYQIIIFPASEMLNTISR